MRLLLMVLVAVPAQAQVAIPAIPYAPEHYIAFLAPEPLVIDGRLDDPAWQAAPWTGDFVDITGADPLRPRYRTRARMLWDSTYLYIGAELEEPHLQATLTMRDAVIFHDNDFEVFIDPDGDTHEYYELEVNALNTVWDLFLVKPYRDGGPAIDAWDIAGLKTAVSLDGTLNVPTDHDTVWTVEIAIPWDVLGEAAHRPSPPGPGDQWRINFSRVEWRFEPSIAGYVKVVDPTTGKPLPEDNWVWSPQGLVNMHYPEMWGVVQFSCRTDRADRAVGRSGGQADGADGNANHGGAEGAEDCKGDDGVFRPDSADAVRWALRQVYYAEQNWKAKHGEYATDAGALNVRWRGRLTASTSRFEACMDGVCIGEEGRLVERNRE